MQTYKGYKMELNWDASQSNKNFRATKENHLFFGNSCKELKKQIDNVDNENGKNKIEQIRELIYGLRDNDNIELIKELCTLERQLRVVQNLIER